MSAPDLVRQLDVFTAKANDYYAYRSRSRVQALADLGLLLQEAAVVDGTHPASVIAFRFDVDDAHVCADRLLSTGDWPAQWQGQWLACALRLGRTRIMLRDCAAPTALPASQRAWLRALPARAEEVRTIGVNGIDGSFCVHENSDDYRNYSIHGAAVYCAGSDPRTRIEIFGDPTVAFAGP